MKLIERTTRLLVPAMTLFSVSVAWAAEPPQAEATATNAQVASPERGAPVAAPAQPTNSAVNSAAANPTVAPAVAPAASPNSVEASPYGSGVNDAPPAAAAPSPSPKNDVPATLFNSGADYAIGGFGGLGVMYTRFAGYDRPLVCGEGAVIIDHKITLGGGGCGIASIMNGERFGTAPHSTGDRMSFGYGGAIARYHFFSRQTVNLAVGALVGAGGIQIATWNGTGDEFDVGNNYTSKSQDAVFVFEPQIGGYLNLTRWLRLGVAGGFRFVSGVETKGLSASDVMGPTIGGQIQAGWF